MSFLTVSHSTIYRYREPVVLGELRFESTLTLEHFDSTQPEYPLEDYAQSYPFRYSDKDFPNLARALSPCYHHASIAKWALSFLDASDSAGAAAAILRY